MKISTKGRYALRLMLDIAMHDDVEPVRLKDVAKRQCISMKYLEQIIAQLVKSGLVSSTRGASGGYRLNKQPADYTVGMILRQVEGEMVPVSCLEASAEECERKGGCVTLRIWKELDEAVRSVLDKYTLADLMEWNEEI